MRWVLFHSFSLLDTQTCVTSCLGVRVCPPASRECFAIHTGGRVSKALMAYCSGHWVGSEVGRAGVQWRQLGFKCSSLHLGKPHISDLMSSFCGSMQMVLVVMCTVDMYVAGHTNWKVKLTKVTAPRPVVLWVWTLKLKLGEGIFPLLKLIIINEDEVPQDRDTFKNPTAVVTFYVWSKLTFTN